MERPRGRAKREDEVADETDNTVSRLLRQLKNWVSQGTATKKKQNFDRLQSEYESRIGDLQAETDEGSKLIRFEKDGAFDYEAYREIQELANIAKIDKSFAKEENIAHLARYLSQELGTVSFGLCHGTRRGLEQSWFEAHLGQGADILGTEISETASQFPRTIQWDFHETKPEWIGACDFVYSNSWDHAFDPQKAIKGWITCLKPSGLLLLEHTSAHNPEHAMPSDPFGISRSRFVEFLNDLGREAPRPFAVKTVLDDLPARTREDVVLVVGLTGL